MDCDMNVGRIWWLAKNDWRMDNICPIKVVLSSDLKFVVRLKDNQWSSKLDKAEKDLWKGYTHWQSKLKICWQLAGVSKLCLSIKGQWKQLEAFQMILWTLQWPIHDSQTRCEHHNFPNILWRLRNYNAYIKLKLELTIKLKLVLGGICICIFCFSSVVLSL